jgi:hypothetical protein
MENRSRAMREHCIGATRKNGREQASVSRQKAVPHRVDPLLDPVELPGSGSLSREIRVQIRQLPEGDESILASRQIREATIETLLPLPPTGRSPLRQSGFRPVGKGGLGHVPRLASLDARVVRASCKKGDGSGQ